MGYIDKNLLPGEQILFRTKKHLIIFFYPLVVALFCIYAIGYMLANPILVHVAWAPAIVAFVFGFSVWLNYITSDFAITEKRVMMREGFFYRHANEVRIATISQVNVDQNLIGQIFNYGTVSINTFGAFDAYTLIAKPNLFQKYVNGQLDKIAK
jgi:uncharacterized membrane protein YdbT with pleckstrin-like domain